MVFPADLSAVEDNVDDVMAAHVNAIEEKLGVDDSAVETSFDYFLRTGWINPGETWVYVGAYSFEVEDVDVAAKFPKGTKIRYKQGGAYEYGYVIDSSFEDPHTLVTLAPNADYALADAAITDNFYSYLSTPQGFPKVFTYTPTLTGATLGNGTILGYFLIEGGLLKANAYFKLGSTSSVDGSFAFSLPVEVGLTTAPEWYGEARVFNAANGAGYWQCLSYVRGSLWPARLYAYIGDGSANIINATNPITFAVNDVITMCISYPI